MAEGIVYLIDLLNNGNDQRYGISPGNFVAALRKGMQTEPEKFPQLVESFEARIRRSYPDWSPDEVRQRTLGNISGFALMADHDYNTEMMIKAATHAIIILKSHAQSINAKVWEENAFILKLTK